MAPGARQGRQVEGARGERLAGEVRRRVNERPPAGGLLPSMSSRTSGSSADLRGRSSNVTNTAGFVVATMPATRNWSAQHGLAAPAVPATRVTRPPRQPAARDGVQALDARGDARDFDGVHGHAAPLSRPQRTRSRSDRSPTMRRTGAGATRTTIGVATIRSASAISGCSAEIHHFAPSTDTGQEHTQLRDLRRDRAFGGRRAADDVELERGVVHRGVDGAPGTGGRRSVRLRRFANTPGAPPPKSCMRGGGRGVGRRHG